MAVEKERFSFNLPDAKRVEVVVLELPDGRLVVRTPEEVELLPPEVPRAETQR